MSNELDKLKQLATEAPQGVWRTCGCDHGGCKCGLVWDLDMDFPVASANTGDELVGYAKPEVMKSVAAYIAAANPATVLSLIAAIERQAEALKALEPFLNWAAGEGIMLKGVGADDLYIKLFPAEYQAALDDGMEAKG